MLLLLQTMYVANWTPEKGWDQGTLQAYGPLPMMPSAQVLNYGQAIFEGMKAQQVRRVGGRGQATSRSACCCFS